MRQKVLYSESHRDSAGIGSVALESECCVVLPTNRKSHNHNFSLCSGTSTKVKKQWRTVLTLGGPMMQTSFEVGCEVLKTGQMIFLSGLFHCYCESPGLDKAAENKETKSEDGNINLQYILKFCFM